MNDNTNGYGTNDNPEILIGGKPLTPGYCIIQLTLHDDAIVILGDTDPIVRFGKTSMWCLPALAIIPFVDEWEEEMDNWLILHDQIRIEGDVITDQNGLRYWLYKDGRAALQEHQMAVMEIDCLEEETP